MHISPFYLYVYYVFCRINYITLSRSILHLREFAFSEGGSHPSTSDGLVAFANLTLICQNLNKSEDSLDDSGFTEKSVADDAVLAMSRRVSHGFLDQRMDDLDNNPNLLLEGFRAVFSPERWQKDTMVNKEV